MLKIQSDEDKLNAHVKIMPNQIYRYSL